MSIEGFGFGHQKFGRFPWGHSDFGEDTVVRSFFDGYKEDVDGQENELMLHYLYTIKDSVNRVRKLIEDVPDQVDVDRVRYDLLRYLGTTISVTIDDVEPVDFQRSLVGSAVQFFRIKGTAQSYKIRGKISGFDVDVYNMYRILPAYVPLFPVENVFELPAYSGVYYTDLPPGSVSGTPTEIACDYCLTSYVKLTFTIVKTQPPSLQGAPNFFDRLVYKLRDIIPIHVRDILFEIRAFILANEHDNMSVPLVVTEDIYTPCPMWNRFDAVTADVVPCDNYGYVNGTATIV